MWVAYVIGDEEHMHPIPDVPTPQGLARSNNVAEYQALLLLLRRIRAMDGASKATSFVIRGDSQLVVYQMLGRYGVRDAKLLRLHLEARRLAAELSVTFEWVPRDRNRAGRLLE